MKFPNVFYVSFLWPLFRPYFLSQKRCKNAGLLQRVPRSLILVVLKNNERVSYGKGGLYQTQNQPNRTQPVTVKEAKKQMLINQKLPKYALQLFMYILHYKTSFLSRTSNLTNYVSLSIDDIWLIRTIRTCINYMVIDSYFK